MKAEFVACFEAIVHALWLWIFISGFGIADSIARSLRVYCDNFAAIIFSKNDKDNNVTKHIVPKYLAFKERIQKQKASIVHNKTELMIVDPFTKWLPPKTFEEHIDRMGLSCNS